jgi:hypothetical protein
MSLSEISPDLLMVCVQFARKSFDVSNTTWVLVSVAVRIGEKLRLYANTHMHAGLSDSTIPEL